MGILAQEMAQAIQSTRINIHCTGTNIHKRISDAMGVGVPNVVMHNEADDGPFGIEQFFEPDVDFIRVNYDNFIDKTKEYLQNPKKCAEIANSAMQKVTHKYTWLHQCREIVRDIEELF